MTFARSRHRQARAAWLASVVLLLAALAPVLSRALAASGQTQWIEVCTAGGVQWVSAGGETDDRPGSDRSGRGEPGDCPLCLLAAEGFAALTSPAFDLRRYRADPHAPAPYAMPLVPARTTCSASPRGPPDAAALVLLG